MLMNLLNYDRTQLRALLGDWGEQSFRADQLIKWIHQLGVIDFAAMSNLSKTLRNKLAAMATIAVPEIAYHSIAADETQKWLLRLADGNIIETVFIPEKARGTLCIS